MTFWFWNCVTCGIFCVLIFCGLSSFLGCQRQPEYWKSKMKVNEEEILRTKNQEMQLKLKTTKVNVAKLQVYSIIRSYYFWPTTVAYECKLSGCPGILAWVSNLFVLAECPVLYPWLDGSDIIPGVSCKHDTFLATFIPKFQNFWYFTQIINFKFTYVHICTYVCKHVHAHARVRMCL